VIFLLSRTTFPIAVSSLLAALEAVSASSTAFSLPFALPLLPFALPCCLALTASGAKAASEARADRLFSVFDSFSVRSVIWDVV
jgi:hypothetical protein